MNRQATLLTIVSPQSYYHVGQLVVVAGLEAWWKIFILVEKHRS